MAQVTATTDFKTPRKPLARVVLEVGDRYVLARQTEWLLEIYMDDDEERHDAQCYFSGARLNNDESSNGILSQ